MKTDKTIVICYCNDKGGIGKTACSITVAYELAVRGYNILFIDSDPQGNATDNLSVNILDLLDKHQTLYDALHNNDNVKKYIASTPYDRLDILASDNRMTNKVPELEVLWGNFQYPYLTLVNAVRDIHKYDFIIFDTRPSVGAENSQVFIASDYVVIPTTTNQRSTAGIERTIRILKTNNDQLNQCNTKVIGIAVNGVNTQTQIAKQVIPALQKEYGKLLFDTIVPIDENVKKAEQVYQPVQNLFPSSKASVAYRKLTDELLQRIKV